MHRSERASCTGRRSHSACSVWPSISLAHLSSSCTETSSQLLCHGRRSSHRHLAAQAPLPGESRLRAGRGHRSRTTRKPDKGSSTGPAKVQQERLTRRQQASCVPSSRPSTSSKLTLPHSGPLCLSPWPATSFSQGAGRPAGSVLPLQHDDERPALAGYCPRIASQR